MKKFALLILVILAASFYLVGCSGEGMGDAPDGRPQTLPATSTSPLPNPSFSPEPIPSYTPSPFPSQQQLQWRTLSNIPTTEILTCIWGSSKDDIWVGGENGTLLHYDGKEWKKTEIFTTPEKVRSISGNSATNVYLVTSGKFYKYDGTTWQEIKYGDSSVLFSDIFVTQDSKIYITAQMHYAYTHMSALFTWDGSTLKSLGISEVAFAKIWPFSNSHVYLAGVGEQPMDYAHGRISIFNNDSFGTMYTIGDEPEYFVDIWASSENDIWVTGNYGNIWHSTMPGLWCQLNTDNTKETFNTVWGISSNDVYFGGSNGILYHWNGYRRNIVDSGTKEHIVQIWGTSSTNIYAVGTNGLIMHYSYSADE